MPITKILAVFVYPLWLFFLLVALAGLLRLFRFARAALAVLVVAVALLWAAATPAVARWLYWQLESRYPPVPLADSPVADAAVLLGGAVEPNIPPRRAVELNHAADRIVHAADLFHAGKVRVIVLSGGNLRQTSLKEAEQMAEVLDKLAVPRAALVLEDRSRTTRENAARVAEIWRERGFRSGLLVTSAAHMGRSLAAFRAAGLDLMPSPTDVEVALPISRWALDWVPEADSLLLSQRAAHEFVASRVYALRSWAETPEPEATE